MIGAEHDHAGDLEDGGVDLVGVLGSLVGGSMSHPTKSRDDHRHIEQGGIHDRDSSS